MDLQSARELLGLTLAETDRRAKLPKGTTRDIESGRNQNPTVHVAIAIFRVLKRGGLEGLHMETVFPRRRGGSNGDITKRDGASRGTRDQKKRVPRKPATVGRNV